MLSKMCIKIFLLSRHGMYQHVCECNQFHDNISQIESLRSPLDELKERSGCLADTLRLCYKWL